MPRLLKAEADWLRCNGLNFLAGTDSSEMLATETVDIAEN
jgi:hypothetical protein